MIKSDNIRVRLTTEEKAALEQLSESVLGRKNSSRLVRKLVRDAIGAGPDLLYATGELVCG